MKENVKVCGDPKWGDWFELNLMSTIHQYLDRCDKLLTKNFLTCGRLATTLDSIIEEFDNFMEEYPETYPSREIRSWFEAIPIGLQVLEDVLYLCEKMNNLKNSKRIKKYLNLLMKKYLEFLRSYIVKVDNNDIIQYIWTIKNEVEHAVRIELEKEREEALNDGVSTNEQPLSIEPQGASNKNPDPMIRADLNACDAKDGSVPVHVEVESSNQSSPTLLGLGVNDSERNILGGYRSRAVLRKKTSKRKSRCQKASSKETKRDEGPSMKELLKMTENGLSLMQAKIETQRRDSMTDVRFISWIGDIYHESFSPTLKTISKLTNLLLTI